MLPGDHLHLHLRADPGARAGAVCRKDGRFVENSLCDAT